MSAAGPACITRQPRLCLGALARHAQQKAYDTPTPRSNVRGGASCTFDSGGRRRGPGCERYLAASASSTRSVISSGSAKPMIVVTWCAPSISTSVGAVTTRDLLGDQADLLRGQHSLRGCLHRVSRLGALGARRRRLRSSRPWLWARSCLDGLVRVVDRQLVAAGALVRQIGVALSPSGRERTNRCGAMRA